MIYEVYSYYHILEEKSRKLVVHSKQDQRPLYDSLESVLMELNDATFLFEADSWSPVKVLQKPV